ncbi:hypothetical protein CJ671_02695 [Aliarcobacter cryaerophilus]|uniref:Cell division protein ZapB n=2 Tax=Aliarcobacter cryaerophilus TaxID=28198 RepID=A0A2S9SV01_9BACT|nr:hypothetical protein [Aliarcobacter cryaerophilus]PRM90413.1 hypothetical protein CJ671_02695 [Aliarcobacter cryaerophilus]PRM97064.1 hypothetical protein CJ670_06135 [Arcobacter cryaerophilus gv. crypticus]
MEIITLLNERIDNLLEEHAKIKLEKIALEKKISELIDENDKLERNNQDMILKIDSTLTLIKGNKSD